MKKSIYKILSVIMIMAIALTMTAFANGGALQDKANTAEPDVTLKVEPSVSEVEASSESVDVTYTITLTPAAGKKIGYFEFKLNPSAGITVNSATINRDLLYVEDIFPDGIFETNKYTDATMYLLCTGTTAERNLSNETVVLTVNASIDTAAGTQTLGLAGAKAALDGSSTPYSVEVIPGDVTIAGQNADAPATNEENKDTDPEDKESTKELTSEERAEDVICLKIDNPSAFANGKYGLIDSANDKVVPYIKNDRTLVPLRFVSETLGAQVEWENGWNYCYVNKGDKKIKITFGSADIEVNGDVVTYDAPVEVVQGRTMVPIRFISEELGYHVYWNQPNRVVIITPKDNPWVEKRSAESTLLLDVLVSFLMKKLM